MQTEWKVVVLGVVDNCSSIYQILTFTLLLITRHGVTEQRHRAGTALQHSYNPITPLYYTDL